MKKNVLKTLVLLMVLAMLSFYSVSSYAVPALDIEELTYQPSGEDFITILHGDEWNSWITTKDGVVLVEGEDKYWYYAKIKNNELVASNARYLIDKKPKKIIKNDDVVNLFKNKEKPKNIVADIKESSFDDLYRSAGLNNVREDSVLILLVEFNDRAMQYADNKWYDKFFTNDGKSVNAYFDEVSNGRFKFIPVTENCGTMNDGVVKVKLNQNHPNYGKNIGLNAQKLVADALTAADKYIDYAKYDKDNDGMVSAQELHVVTIIAGYEAAAGKEFTPNIWGHRWATSVSLDGKTLGEYTQQGEIHKDHIATIGVLCHELSHNLGLPDLYDYDKSSNGVGVHSLMAMGAWGRVGNSLKGSSPVHLDAWSKVKLGFVDPVVVKNSGIYNVNSIATNKYGVVKIPTVRSREYFLIENRQLSGFDKALAAGKVKNGGIAIWHIDESIWNNNDEKHKKVDLEEANEGKLGYSELDTKKAYGGNHYYYYGFQNLFNATTSPNTKLYSGYSSKIAVEVLDGISNSMRIKVDLDVADGGKTIKEWQAGVYYKKREFVMYKGTPYKCMIPHTALNGWEPNKTPALWVRKN